jgi:hypothetical protein
MFVVYQNPLDLFILLNMFIRFLPSDKYILPAVSHNSQTTGFESTTISLTELSKMVGI